MTLTPHTQFDLLLKLRVRNCRNQTRDLYRRYRQVAFLIAGLFGLVIVERPGLIALPILAFADTPFEWLSNLQYLAIWLLAAMVWVSLHKEFLLGSGLAEFAQSLPISRTVHVGVDLALLLRSLTVLAIPLCIAAVTVIRSDHAMGEDGRFWLHLPLLVFLTISLCKSLVFGNPPGAILFQTAAVPATVATPLICAMENGWVVSVVLAACLLLACANGRRIGVTSRYVSGIGNAMVNAAPIVAVPWLQIRMLFVHRWSATWPRISIAAVPPMFAVFLIGDGRHSGDAAVFMHLAMGSSTGIVSGLHRVLHESSSTMFTFAKSTPYGVLILQIAGHLIVAATGVLAVAASLPWAATRSLTFPPLGFSQIATYYFVLIPLLGNRMIQGHPQTVLIRACVTGLWMGMGMWIL